MPGGLTVVFRDHTPLCKRNILSLPTAQPSPPPRGTQTSRKGGDPVGMLLLRSIQFVPLYSSSTTVSTPPTAQPCEGESMATALMGASVGLDACDHTPLVACQ